MYYTTEQLKAQQEMAISILPIIFQSENISPDLARRGWLLLLYLIYNRIGRERFNQLIKDCIEDRNKLDSIPGYIKLAEELRTGHKGEGLIW